MSVRYHAYLVRKNSFRVEPERASVHFDQYAVAQLDHFISTFRAVRGPRSINARVYKLPCARDVESINPAASAQHSSSVPSNPFPPSLSPLPCDYLSIECAEVDRRGFEPTKMAHSDREGASRVAYCVFEATWKNSRTFVSNSSFQMTNAFSEVKFCMLRKN